MGVREELARLLAPICSEHAHKALSQIQRVVLATDSQRRDDIANRDSADKKRETWMDWLSTAIGQNPNPRPALQASLRKSIAICS